MPKVFRLIHEAVEKLNPQLWDSQMTSFEKASCEGFFDRLMDYTHDKLTNLAFRSAAHYIDDAHKEEGAPEETPSHSISLSLFTGKLFK